MNENLYSKELTCPVCLKNFMVTKVKMKACRVESRDTDFCVHYKDINPMFYDAWVCENCGYASLSDKFEEITPRETDILKKELTPRWNKRKFDKERNIDAAIEAFKLVLYNYQLRGSKASEIAKVCMRIAWLYRMKKDAREYDFVKFALKAYNDVYENEHFPADKLDESTCMYIIGELSRRAGNFDDATKWLSKLISSPEARKKPALMEAARDQYQLVKKQMAGE